MLVSRAQEEEHFDIIFITADYTVSADKLNLVVVSYIDQGEFSVNCQ